MLSRKGGTNTKPHEDARSHTKKFGKTDLATTQFSFHLRVSSCAFVPLRVNSKNTFLGGRGVDE